MNIQEIYQKNIDFLYSFDKTLYDNIQNTTLSDYNLTLHDNQLNVSIKGKVLYPNNSSEFITLQVNNFLQNPSSYSKTPSTTPIIANQDIHNIFFNKIKQISPFNYEKETFTNYFQHLDEYFPSLILYGIGTGIHIYELLNKVTVNHLIIVDQDYSFLKISMHVLDWTKIFTKFSDSKKSIKFYIDSNYEKIGKLILNDFFSQSPFLIDFIPYFVHYQTEHLINIHNTILENIHFSYTGLGWYDDEIIGLRNTINNIKSKYPFYSKNSYKLDDASVFIVGSGPSIDQDIDTIKKNTKNVIIFSCASAINILKENSITPDFHFEMERFEKLHEYRKNSISLNYIKNINLITLNVVSSKMSRLFKSTYIVSRNDDCGSSIISNNICKLNFTNPTAVNMAINFASEVGFKNIYLFGVDMGFKSQEYHHSKFSAYSIGDKTDDKVFETYNPNSLIKEEKFQGNFNPKELFQSTSVFLLCKLRVENCIRHYNESVFYNCSDGLSIEYTLPKKSSEVIVSLPLKKSTYINRIIDSFNNDNLDTVSKNNFHTNKQMILNDIDKIIDILLTKKITSISDMYSIFIDIFQIITEDKSSFTLPLLRGSCTNIFSFIITHALATQDFNKALIFINESRNILNDFFEDIKKEILSISFN